MIIQGDCIEVMAGMPENSIDAIVTDPPYGLEFMGKEWDRLWATRDKSQDLTGKSSSPFLAARVNEYRGGTTAQLWHTQWATQALRVLKPGGYLLAFGGTRTSHRLVCGLEDAGFEIRDTICWLYGSGFPKNLDISKQIDKMAGAEREIVGIREDFAKRVVNPRKVGNEQSRLYGIDKRLGDEAYKITTPATEAAKGWQGWGTALKPAHEPICVARKPLSEKNVASNVLRWRTGGIDIDGSRIGTEKWEHKASKTSPYKSERVWDTKGNTPDIDRCGIGRWPANVILECTCEEVVEGESIKSGNFPSFGGDFGKHGRYGKAKGINQKARQLTDNPIIHTDPNCPCYMLDEQSGELQSSYVTKSSNKGLIGHPTQKIDKPGGASRFFYCAKASSKERGNGNTHPTCKPIKLMEYLIKLVSREGATILDPFAGSGSTVLAAMALGRKCIGIEQSEEYCEIARGRCTQMVLA